MPKVEVTDTILRDAHQCLIATRMRTEDMLPICDKLDTVGYWSLEAWGGATFDACVRFLREDPWERLRKLRKALPNTRIQMLLRGQNLLGYRHYSDDVVRTFVQHAASNGVDVFRIFDAMNDIRNLQVAIEETIKQGKHAQGTICYTTSPVHSIKTFTDMAKELQALGCHSLAIKDMAGLLTPTATTELVRSLKQAIDIPLHLHSHATSGMADMCQLKAIENGCYHIDTALSSFSNGASHPPTESMVAALRETEYDTELNLELLQEIGMYFHEVRKKYHQFESEFAGLDTRVQVNQVPGGMISNLYSQLREQGALQHMNDVLAEIPKVRADLGYPPLVTPTSQIIGTQAVLNVITGERYKTITNEVKLYLQGRYGKALGTINEGVRRQAIGNEDVIECRPADLLENEMEKMTKEIGELANNVEDVLTYAMFPEIGRTFLEQRRDNTLVPEPLEPVQSRQSNGHPAPVEFNVTMHGESYHIKVTGTGHKNLETRPFYVSVDGMPEEILVETLDELPQDSSNLTTSPQAKNSKNPRANKPGHVTTSMPGTIVEVLVKEGDDVKAGDPVLVSEAMKMETEIQAPITGKVIRIHVKKGDSVNPDEALIELE